MLEAEWFQMKSEFFINRKRIVYGPFFWQIKEFPFAASFFAPVIMSVQFVPVFICLGSVPYDLGIGTE